MAQPLTVRPLHRAEFYVRTFEIGRIFQFTEDAELKKCTGIIISYFASLKYETKNVIVERLDVNDVRIHRIESGSTGFRGSPASDLFQLSRNAACCIWIHFRTSRI